MVSWYCPFALDHVRAHTLTLTLTLTLTHTHVQALGTHALHRLKLVHMDIKPATS